MSDAKKMAAQLGMPIGTAANRLRKALLFDMAIELQRNVCFRCGKVIDKVDDLSIEHKEPWLDSANPKAKFFDLNNIAFSHLRCNQAAATRTYADHGTRRRYWNHGCRCPECAGAKEMYRSPASIS